MLGSDAMMHVKKLRLLQRKGDDISKTKLLEKTRKYLDVIGTRISELCSDEGDPSAREDLHSDLWQVHILTYLCNMPTQQLRCPLAGRVHATINIDFVQIKAIG